MRQLRKRQHLQSPSTYPAYEISCPAGGSPYGLLDMAGNVAERVAEWYYNYTAPPIERSTPKAYPGELFMLRGGSWIDDAQASRLADRIHSSESAADIVGFRCAMDAS